MDYKRGDRIVFCGVDGALTVGTVAIVGLTYIDADQPKPYVTFEDNTTILGSTAILGPESDLEAVIERYLGDMRSDLQRKHDALMAFLKGRL